MRRTAWEEIGQSEEDVVWSAFERRFKFRPSTEEMPGIREPSDSVTFDIGHVYGDPTHYSRLTMDLCCKFRDALQKCVAPGGHVNVLDWQHQSYRFSPHEPFEFASEDDWSIPALPNGDYYIFLDPELRFGVFGHPWERTMCVFGRELLEALSQDMPKVFAHEIRRGGLRV